VDRAPAWLDLQAPRRLRPARGQRNTQLEVAHLPLRQGFGLVWRRLEDPTIHRPNRLCCQRILHGCIGVKAYLGHVRAKDPAFTYDPAACVCDNPECAAAGTLETVTHAFWTCPAVRPVIQWLRDTWLCLATDYEDDPTPDPAPAGLAQPRPAPPFAVVPDSMDVILADDLEAWPQHPRGRGLLSLWTRLRVATLGAIWEVRCSREEAAAPFAQRAVALAVQRVRDAIQRDWARTHQDMRMLDDGSFCTAWWRGFDAALAPAAFQAQWPPLFHRLRGQPPAAGEKESRILDVVLTTDYVPLQGVVPLEEEASLTS